MRVCKTGKCKSCKEEKKIYCKKMCQKCYVRAYRKTPSGSKSMKKYNDEKGVEASRIWRLKHHTPRDKKQLNRDKVCGCGGVVIAKDLCQKCYHRVRNNSKARAEGRETKKRVLKPKTIESDVFDRLLEMVRSGIPAYKSFQYEGITSSQFYSYASESQKLEIKFNKKLKGNIEIL